MTYQLVALTNVIHFAPLLTAFPAWAPPCAGKNGVIAPDQTTYDYVKARTNEEFESVFTDAAANFIADYKVSCNACLQSTLCTHGVVILWACAGN